MKKSVFSAAVLSGSALSLSALAGGLVTNTNQNAAFLRQLSQEAIIDITGLYANPAGTAFLSPGAHASFNIQNAKQSRDIRTSFALMQYNNTYNSPTRQYKGEADAPVIPSVQYSYNWKRWSVNANFSLGGGGGKCEFDNGLGSFESLYAAGAYSAARTQIIPLANAAVQNASGINPDYAYAGYTLNAYMKGRQYYFGLSVGTTYKILDNLAVYGGLRAVYASCNYNGWVEDINVNLQTQLPSPYAEALAQYGVAQYSYELSNNALSLNADQTGLGWTPILGIDWKINAQWNVAARFEFKTRLRLKNDSEMNAYTAEVVETNPTLGQFRDGSKIAADIPAFFSAGVQYAPIPTLRIQTGYHLFGDKNATQYNNKHDNIDKNCWEITAGVEYDLHKRVTVSAGWQTTNYGLNDAYMNDLSFVTNSHSYGLGARVHVNQKISLDLSFMQTIYQRRDVVTQNYLNSGLDKTDHYKRTNRVFGIGLNYEF